MTQEMEAHILQEFKDYEKVRYEELQNMIKKKIEIPSESRVAIEHTFINFVPLINKIKIDLLMKR